MLGDKGFLVRDEVLQLFVEHSHLLIRAGLKAKIFQSRPPDAPPPDALLNILRSPAGESRYDQLGDAFVPRVMLAGIAVDDLAVQADESVELRAGLELVDGDHGIGST